MPDTLHDGIADAFSDVDSDSTMGHELLYLIEVSVGHFQTTFQSTYFFNLRLVCHYCCIWETSLHELTQLWF